MIWTRGTTIVEYCIRPYGTVPIVWLGLNLPSMIPPGATALAWQWNPWATAFRPPTRAARLMARMRRWDAGRK